MGRQAAGVIGIRLRKDDYVVGMEVINDTRDILFATAGGYGKRVHPEDFRVAHRGGYGVRTIPTDKRNGRVIGLTKVGDDSHILLIDTAGKIIRLSPQEIRTMGRQAMGVRLIKLDDGQLLSTVVAFDGTEVESDDHDNSQTPSSPQQKMSTEEESAPMVLSPLSEDSEPDYLNSSTVDQMQLFTANNEDLNV